MNTYQSYYVAAHQKQISAIFNDGLVLQDNQNFLLSRSPQGALQAVSSASDADSNDLSKYAILKVSIPKCQAKELLEEVNAKGHLDIYALKTTIPADCISTGLMMVS